MKITILTLLLLCLRAGAMDGEKAVQAVIGEAAGEPFASKVAIAAAIRNRGTLEGVRGVRNQRMIQSQTPAVWNAARAAWAQSATNDVTHGGTHWESSNFKTPSWSRNMTKTATIGRFRFFKP
jgi:spore germination cell wall hydrolase CwlJ-like protein